MQAVINGFSQHNAGYNSVILTEILRYDVVVAESHLNTYTDCYMS